MRILYLGDIVGRSGRDAIQNNLNDLRTRLKLDFVVANGENTAAGFGMTGKICDQLFEAGVDVVTGGNHSFDQKEIKSVIDREPRILRPANYPQGTPGRGSHVYQTVRGKKVAVINLLGQVFMNPLANPFHTVEEFLAKNRLGGVVDAVIVDIHGEATSEKMAMGHFCDGRASLVVGSHSHIPTGDAQILDGGTGYQTDAGMCGDYNSVIGNDKEEPIRRFTTKMNSKRYEPAKGPGTMCGVFVETDNKSGHALRIEPVRIGARLIETEPKL